MRQHDCTVEVEEGASERGAEPPAAHQGTASGDGVAGDGRVEMVNAAALVKNGPTHSRTAGEAWKWQHVKRKTDRDDAIKLARLAAMGELLLERYRFLLIQLDTNEAKLDAIGSMDKQVSLLRTKSASEESAVTSLKT